MTWNLTKEEMDILIETLAEGFKLSKAEAKRVYEQGGFHFEQEEMVVRKGKKDLIRLRFSK